MSKTREINLVQCKTSLEGDAARLQGKMRLAAGLNMSIADFDSQIQKALEALAPIEARLLALSPESGGVAQVPEEEFEGVLQASSQLGMLEHKLEVCFGIWRTMQQALGQLNYLVTMGKGASRNYRLGEGVTSNDYLQGLLRQAAEAPARLEKAQQRFQECQTALLALDYQEAARKLNEARQFAGTESLIAVLVKRGTIY